MCSTTTVTPRLELPIKCLVTVILCTDDVLTSTSSNVAEWNVNSKQLYMASVGG